MCGIAGIVDFEGGRIDRQLIEAMCFAIRHRGPDDQGIVHLPDHASGNRPAVALGSRRLSIIDVQGGHQPIASEDRSVWVVLNGEIYNFQRLRARLEADGHRFATQSDTEVLVHLYEERGDDFVRDLDGMFALALWDDRRQRLVLARDRFGKKPLLYADRATSISFASEFTALLADPKVSRGLDRQALGYYLTYLSVPAPMTMYEGIRKLMPGHVLIRESGRSEVRPYWKLERQPRTTIDENEATEQLRVLLKDAVRNRLISEVPLGAFLSGGVDSSVVVAVMASLSARPVKTFSIGFDETEYSELPYARRVAHQFGCDHHEMVVRPRAVEVLPLLVRHFGEPFADSSAIPTYYLSRFTREHVTVALNGDGGDEMFAGYERHLAFRLAEMWQRAPAAARHAAAMVARWVAPSGADFKNRRTRLARFLRAAGLSRADRYRAWIGVVGPELQRDLVESPVAFDNHDIVDEMFEQTRDLDAVEAALAVDTAFYLPTDLLVKMDIMSMANSLEARSPFLDHHLAEFVARLPAKFKLRGATSKYLLKKAFSGTLPADILNRRKSGFAVPIAHWLRGELRDFVRDHLLSARSLSRGLFRADAVRRLVEEHAAGRADHASRLWVLLMLELWHQQFVDTTATPELPVVAGARAC